jgi:CelD/BcsL family acetyltransferase involved in cellulose biosynthesis
MHTELITQISGLEAIADQWNGLALPSPMQSPEWLIPWWQVYGGANRKLAVLIVRAADGRLLGLCPWYVEARPRAHRLRWLGDGAACSDHTGILLPEHPNREVVQVVVDWLRDTSALRWDQLALESVDVDDSVQESFVLGMCRRGVLSAVREEAGSAWIRLPSSWDDYLAIVSKNHRKRCRRWQREFFDTGRTRVQVVTDSTDCVEAYEKLVSLHNQRRKSAGTRGAFEDARFNRFHQLTIRHLARREKLQLRLLSVDHQLAAVEYVLVDDATAFAYQSGLSSFGESLSAGNLSMLSLIRDTIDHGKRRVDLLRGTEAYKFSWGAAHRPARTIVLRRRSPSGLLQSYLDDTMQWARRVKRSNGFLKVRAS